MARQVTHTYSPDQETEADWLEFKDYCIENNISVNSVISSFIPAINYAINNKVIEQDGEFFVHADFGHIKLKYKK